MFVKVKPQVFIDTLTLEFFSPQSDPLKAVLKDDKGSVCKCLETSDHQERLTWSGLNDLPYGVYTIELERGEEKMKTQIIKRV